MQDLEGEYLFTGVVSFHPQRRNANDVANEGKVEKSEAV